MYLGSMLFHNSQKGRGATVRRKNAQEIVTLYTMHKSPCMDELTTQPLSRPAMAEFDIPPQLVRGKTVGKGRHEGMWVFFQVFTYPMTVDTSRATHELPWSHCCHHGALL